MTDNTPSRDDVMEAINEASELRDEIIEYRNMAQKIDDDFVEQHDEDAQEIYLAILPYGEELVRTSDLADALDDSIGNLKQILNNKTDNAEQLYESALECIKNARDTLEDCAELPKNDEDEEDY